MKVRTVEDLSEALDFALAWRKKELVVLKNSLPRGRQADTATRAAITLGYAHLEGFFKQAATSFLAFVANQTTRLEDLRLAHQARAIALALRTQHNGSPPTDPMVLLLDGLAFFEKERGRSAKLPYKAEVKTHSNLNSEVLRSLLYQTGLDPNLFELRSKQLDEGLLSSRNHVAHGQYLEVGPDEVRLWIEMVLDMCERFRTELGNTAANGHWRR